MGFCSTLVFLLWISFFTLLQSPFYCSCVLRKLLLFSLVLSFSCAESESRVHLEKFPHCLEKTHTLTTKSTDATERHSSNCTQAETCTNPVTEHWADNQVFHFMGVLKLSLRWCLTRFRLQYTLGNCTFQSTKGCSDTRQNNKWTQGNVLKFHVFGPSGNVRRGQWQINYCTCAVGWTTRKLMLNVYHFFYALIKQLSLSLHDFSTCWKML